MRPVENHFIVSRQSGTGVLLGRFRDQKGKFRFPRRFTLQLVRLRLIFVGALILICATFGAQTYSQSGAMFITSPESASAIPANVSDDVPKPYHSVPGWATLLPDGQVWGSVTGVAVD